MKLCELYDTKKFLVIGENTQKYSSTTVSGGDGYVTSNSYGVMGSTAPVTSTQHFHSDQTVWVKDLETDQERQLVFNKSNVAVREGHIIICSWNKESGKMERLLNLNTGKRYSPNGIYNDWTGNGAILKTRAGRFRTAVVHVSYWAAIPLFSLIHMLLSLRAIIVGRGFFWNVKIPGIRKSAFFMLVYDLMLALFCVLEFSRNGLSNSFLYYYGFAFAGYTILHMRMQGKEFAFAKRHSDALDEYLDDYVRQFNQKTSQQAA